MAWLHPTAEIEPMPIAEEAVTCLQQSREHVCQALVCKLSPAASLTCVLDVHCVSPSPAPLVGLKPDSRLCDWWDMYATGI